MGKIQNLSTHITIIPIFQNSPYEYLFYQIISHLIFYFSLGNVTNSSKKIQQSQLQFVGLIKFQKNRMFGDDYIEQQEIKRKQQKLFEQQKKFRNLEADKKHFADESINIIKKQKMTIEKLKKQNEALKELIAKVNNQRVQQNNTGTSMEHMKDFLNEMNMAIQSEKESQKNIDMHISNFQKKIIEKKKNCLGINSGAQNENNLQKQIKILQNRLDKANQKFNETIAINRQLKNVIDSLRRERVIFDSLYEKLEKQLHQKRKQMANIIEKANNAYQQRDKANNQMTTLKTQARKQANEFQKEIKQMSHLMEKIKLTSYVKKVAKGTENQHNFYDTQPPMINQPKNTKQSKKAGQQAEKLQKFRQDFAKIQAATSIKQFEELLRIFSENQEKNFKMFKFVNLQSNQIEELENQVANLKQEAESVKPIDKTQGKDKLIDQLELKLSTIKNKLQECQVQYKSHQKQAKCLSGMIENLFEKIQCDRETAKEIGGSKTICQTNLLVFLAIIQYKAIQIVNTFKQLSHSHLLQQNVKPNNTQPGILNFQDFEDNEQYNTILSANQLRQKAMQFIKKEQGIKQKKKQVRTKKK